MLSTLLSILCTSSSFGGWTLNSSTDEMFGTKITTASTASLDNKAVLVIRCKNERIESFMHARRAIFDYNETEVSVRIDSEKIKTFSGHRGVNSDSLFFDSWIGGMSELAVLANQKIMIHVPGVWMANDNSTYDRTFTFPVSGSTASVGKVRVACGLTPKPPPPPPKDYSSAIGNGPNIATVKVKTTRVFWSQSGFTRFMAPRVINKEGISYLNGDHIPPGEYEIHVIWLPSPSEAANGAEEERAIAGTLIVGDNQKEKIIILCDADSKTCAEVAE